MSQTTTRLRVAVVAEDAQLREELASISLSAGHRVAVARASVPSAEPRPAGCDVAIFAGVPERGLPKVRLAWPDASVVVALADMNSRSVSAGLREGAAGVVSSRKLAATLPATILAVFCGQLCVPYTYAVEAERPELSMREKQILGMVVLGFANIEIAQRLFVAESTVKSHLNSAFRKLGVRSRGEAATLILNPTTGLGTGILTIPTSDPTPHSQRSPED